MLFTNSCAFREFENKYKICILIATFFISNNYCFATFYWPKFDEHFLFWFNLSKCKNHHTNAFPSISCWVWTETTRKNHSKKFSQRKWLQKIGPANDITFVVKRKIFPGLHINQLFQHSFILIYGHDKMDWTEWVEIYVHWEFRGWAHSFCSLSVCVCVALCVVLPTNHTISLQNSTLCLCVMQYRYFRIGFYSPIVVGPLCKHWNIYVRAETERKGRG